MQYQILPIVLILFSLECQGAGVTLVTHGAEIADNYPTWVDEMGDAIALRDGKDTAVVRMEVSSMFPVGLEVTQFSLVQGKWPSQGSESGEVVIKLFWNTVAGITDSATTDEIAGIVLPFFYAPIKFGTNSLPPLSELPFHFIGHSRGASVICELSYFLGLRGIWIDHLTTLDAHPLLSFLEAPLHPDPSLFIPQNVVFLDNYLQTDEYPEGTSLDGSAQLWLSTRGPFAHSDIHAWYYGTITRVNPGPAWWYRDDDIGFLYSSVAGGQILRSRSNPNYQGEGLRWNGASRASLQVVTNASPNIELEFPQEPFLLSGQVWSTKFWAQGVETGAVIGFGWDQDKNPYYNSLADVLRTYWSQSNVNTQQFTVTLLATNLTKTNFYAVVKNPNGIQRFFYLDRSIITKPQRFLSTTVVSNRFQMTAVANERTSFGVQSSTDLVHWINLGSISNSAFNVNFDTKIHHEYYRTVIPPN